MGGGRGEEGRIIWMEERRITVILSREIIVVENDAPENVVQ